MFKRIKEVIHLFRNMGPRYLVFRSKHEMLRRSGLLKRKFPIQPAKIDLPPVEEWRKGKASFFFSGKHDIQLPKRSSAALNTKYKNICEGNIVFFNSILFALGTNYDWVTNPDNGYRYDIRKHWTQVPDFSKEAGDIKYVWEKSRFTFLYDIIRYDYHFNRDCSHFVFNEMVSWIDHNPVNCGPNYRCSQEITLRVLNWTFALYYYRQSAHLTDDIFGKVMQSIYWQMKHVYDNIHFSRIAVRNNHAITETLGLFITGLLFPFLPGAHNWKQKGKKWFEKEIAYQVYPDGTFLQFSMNYHRVVIQLLTWAIRLAEVNKIALDPVVRERAVTSVGFLHNCMNEENGSLPNYGANDGALFFPLNDVDFRDYRPQLHALAAVLKMGAIDKCNEDQHWYGIAEASDKLLQQQQGIIAFPVGGYYLLRERDTFSFIRCGRYKDRPLQADNLHLDLWIGEQNVLRDGGSYKYNTEESLQKYFHGTASHNTVMLDNQDQMQKGRRFIWYYWTQAVEAGWREYESYYEFKGVIQAFRHVGKGIVHKRTVRKYKARWKWQVTDEIVHSNGYEVQQLWHPAVAESMRVDFTACDVREIPIEKKIMKGWYSPKYGMKEEADTLVFSSNINGITTTIEVKNAS
jgi:hypothetical protein